MKNFFLPSLQPNNKGEIFLPTLVERKVTCQNLTVKNILQNPGNIECNNLKVSSSVFVKSNFNISTITTVKKEVTSKSSLDMRNNQINNIAVYKNSTDAGVVNYLKELTPVFYHSTYDGNNKLWTMYTKWDFEKDAKDVYQSANLNKYFIIQNSQIKVLRPGIYDVEANLSKTGSSSGIVKIALSNPAVLGESIKGYLSVEGGNIGSSLRSVFEVSQWEVDNGSNIYLSNAARSVYVRFLVFNIIWRPSSL